MPVLLLFDIDGTLVKMKMGRSKMIFAEIMKELFNIDVSLDSLPNFAGMTDLSILREIGESEGIPFSAILKNIDELWAKMLSIFRKHTDKDVIELLPGVGELIKNLSEIEHFQLGLCTGNFQANAFLKLGVYGIDKYFPSGAFGSDFEDRNLLPPLAIERANSFFSNKPFSLANTVIIGDGPRDVSCARANSLPVVCVATGGFSADLLAGLSPNILFKDFSDYNSVIKKLENHF